MSGTSRTPTDWHVPSAVRSFELYPGGARPGQGLVGPNAIPRWVAKHPLDWSWSWIDATRWCKDIGDVIGQIGWQIIGGDLALEVTQQAIARQYPYCSQWAGMRIRFGTPGQIYLVRIRLTGLSTGEQITSDVQLPIMAAGPVQPINPTQATVNGDALVVGGIPIFAS